jgi:hypothetical protein
VLVVFYCLQALYVPINPILEPNTHDMDKTNAGWPPVLESTGNTGKYWKQKLVLENTGKTVVFHTQYWKVLDF